MCVPYLGYFCVYNVYVYGLHRIRLSLVFEIFFDFAEVLRCSMFRHISTEPHNIH